MQTLVSVKTQVPAAGRAVDVELSQGTSPETLGENLTAFLSTLEQI